MNTRDLDVLEKQLKVTLPAYGKMYDKDEPGIYERYQPFTTIGIIRTGENISVKTVPYLPVPTVNGFVYINLLNKRQELTEADIDENLGSQDNV